MGLELADNVEFGCCCCSTLMWLLGEIQFLFRLLHFLFSKRSFAVDFGEEHELLLELDEHAAGLRSLFEV